MNLFYISDDAVFDSTVSIAQWLEHRSPNTAVVGSSPGGGG